MVLDPRRFAFRDDLADADLAGRVKAPRYAKAELHVVAAPVADVCATPETSSATTQLLFGETVKVFERRDDFAWMQNVSDGYVGYVACDALKPGADAIPKQQISAPMAQVYAAADIKSRARMTLPFLAHVAVQNRVGDFVQTPEGFVHVRHISAIAGDMVSFAEAFIGSPYLWGGRSYLGLDCSALVQLSAMAMGQECPRDSDMQEAEFGKHLHPDEPLKRGDLVFWKGHVGMMIDPETLLHANAHYMATVVEPFARAVERIEGQGGGPVTSRKRV